MNGHPGGTEHTRHMLMLAGLPAGARILDLGAGDGGTVALLRELGYTAEGIDLKPGSSLVRKGDFLHTGEAEESFDAVVSQCAFFVSGDVAGALRESARLLRQNGLLLWSDVFFEGPEPLLKESGFTLVSREDMTEQWKEFYLDSLWQGDECGCELPRRKCRYLLLIGRKA